MICVRYNRRMSVMPSDSSSAASVKSGPFRFRLVHLIYVVTLLATSMGTFGPPGVFAGVPFTFFWIVVFSSRSRPRTFLFAGLVMLLLMCCLYVPATNTAREAARRMMCSNNLKQIALALHYYHQTYSCFPPAFIPDESGQPKHSWRLLILPFLGHQSLYNAYKFDEPWDSPNNRKLLAQRPEEFSCPGHANYSRHNDTRTSYVAVVGPATAWPGPVGKRLSEFADPTSETVLLVGTTGDDILWTEPRDLIIPHALEQLTSTDPEQVGGHRYEDFFEVKFMGRNVAMVNGSVRFLSAGMSRNGWSRLLVDNDEVKPSSVDDLECGITPPSKLKIGNCIRLGVWIAVVLCPLPWVWLGRKPTEQRPVVRGEVRTRCESDEPENPPQTKTAP